MSDFWFKGIPASSFGVIVSGVNTYGAPARLTTGHNIPGANGVYYDDDDVFDNDPRGYECGLFRQRELEAATARIKEWLLSDGNYHRLEDTYAPDVYRMAKIDGRIDTVLAGASGRSIKFALNFTCLPERWLKSGERALTIDSGVGLTLHNPTGFAAAPLLRINAPTGCEISMQMVSDGVYHDAYCTITTESLVEYLGSDKVILLDCKTTEAWFESTGNSANKYVNISGSAILHARKAGDSDFIYLRSGSADIEIKPRWWRI